MKALALHASSYEIQVASSSRGKGLGTRLMQDLLMIGARQRMHKIMLTVLKSKQAAPF